ncbi:MAG: HemK2/MTQ2 family protein methyltransferase [archaeon]
MYPPAEDSYFLTEKVEIYISKLKNKKIKVLDMGSGSGTLAETCINSRIPPEKMTLVDIDKEVVSHLRKKFPKSKVVESNLFSHLKEKFDLIIFNPPYLPEGKYDKEKDTTGGKNGDEIILRFLKKAKKYLNTNGEILLLTSSLTPMKKINKELKTYKVKLIAAKKLFFEELRIWLISA